MTVTSSMTMMKIYDSMIMHLTCGLTMISDDNASDNDGDNIENDSNKNDNSDE